MQTKYNILPASSRAPSAGHTPPPGGAATSRYFPHDYNSARDEKTVSLIVSRGLEGYGIYWRIIEEIYDHGGRIPENYDLLSYTLRIEKEKIIPVLKDFGLFFFEYGKIGSHSVDRRIKEIFKRSKNASNAGKASAKLRNKKSLKQRPFNDRSTTVQHPFNHK